MSNLRSAPDFLTPNKVGRLLEFVDHLKAAPTPPMTPIALPRAEPTSNAAQPKCRGRNLYGAETGQGGRDIARQTEALLAAIRRYHPERCSPPSNAHKILCSTNTPGASGTARKAPSAVSSGTASTAMVPVERRTARAPSREGRKNGHHTHSSVQPVVHNKIAPVADSRKPESQISRNTDWISRRREQLSGAIAFLKGRAILVTPVDRNAEVRTYWVSGKRDRKFAEDVIEIAQGLGWKART